MLFPSSFLCLALEDREENWPHKPPQSQILRNDDCFMDRQQLWGFITLKLVLQEVPFIFLITKLLMIGFQTYKVSTPTILPLSISLYQYLFHPHLPPTSLKRFFKREMGRDREMEGYLPCKPLTWVRFPESHTVPQALQ